MISYVLGIGRGVSVCLAMLCVPFSGIPHVITLPWNFKLLVEGAPVLKLASSVGSVGTGGLGDGGDQCVVVYVDVQIVRVFRITCFVCGACSFMRYRFWRGYGVSTSRVRTLYAMCVAKDGCVRWHFRRMCAFDGVESEMRDYCGVDVVSIYCCCGIRFLNAVGRCKGRAVCDG
eukprot:660462-Amphidinium_carterae.2